MIQLGNEKDRLVSFVKDYGSEVVKRIIFDQGVRSEEDVRALAKFYWGLVETAEGENIEYWLEKIYTSFHIHVGNLGYEEVWEEEMP